MKSSTAFILLLISFGLYYVYIGPEYDKVQALRAQADSYNQVIGNVSDLTQKRDELLLRYQSLPKADVANLDKALPGSVNMVELAIDLDSIASKYGIAVKGIKSADTQSNNAAAAVAAPTSGYQKTQVSFDFVGTYDNMRQFLRDLESSLRLVDIQTLSFQAADNGLNEYTVTATTYWVPETASPAASTPAGSTVPGNPPVPPKPPTP